MCWKVISERMSDVTYISLCHITPLSWVANLYIPDSLSFKMNEILLFAFICTPYFYGYNFLSEK